MLALITITALQRFVKVWNQAEVAPATRERIDLRRERRIERRTVRADRVARSRTVVQRRMRNERRPR
jgi:CDP-diacylglycerol--glycerol-3-phosphate 3-phosphatidyltransferase